MTAPHAPQVATSPAGAAVDAAAAANGAPAEQLHAPVVVGQGGTLPVGVGGGSVGGGSVGDEIEVVDVGNLFGDNDGDAAPAAAAAAAPPPSPPPAAPVGVAAGGQGVGGGDDAAAAAAVGGAGVGGDDAPAAAAGGGQDAGGAVDAAAAVAAGGQGAGDGGGGAPVPAAAPAAAGGAGDAVPPPPPPPPPPPSPPAAAAAGGAGQPPADAPAPAAADTGGAVPLAPAPLQAAPAAAAGAIPGAGGGGGNAPAPAPPPPHSPPAAAAGGAGQPPAAAAAATVAPVAAPVVDGTGVHVQQPPVAAQGDGAAVAPPPPPPPPPAAAGVAARTRGSGKTRSYDEEVKGGRDAGKRRRGGVSTRRSITGRNTFGKVKEFFELAQLTSVSDEGTSKIFQDQHGGLFRVTSVGNEPGVKIEYCSNHESYSIDVTEVAMREMKKIPTTDPESVEKFLHEIEKVAQITASTAHNYELEDCQTEEELYGYLVHHHLTKKLTTSSGAKENEYYWAIDGGFDVLVRYKSGKVSVESKSGSDDPVEILKAVMAKAGIGNDDEEYQQILQQQSQIISKENLNRVLGRSSERDEFERLQIFLRELAANNGMHVDASRASSLSSEDFSFVNQLAPLLSAENCSIKNTTTFRDRISFTRKGKLELTVKVADDSNVVITVDMNSKIPSIESVVRPDDMDDAVVVEAVKSHNARSSRSPRARAGSDVGKPGFGVQSPIVTLPHTPAHIPVRDGWMNRIKAWAHTRAATRAAADAAAAAATRTTADVQTRAVTAASAAATKKNAKSAAGVVRAQNFVTQTEVLPPMVAYGTGDKDAEFRTIHEGGRSKLSAKKDTSGVVCDLATVNLLFKLLHAFGTQVVDGGMSYGDKTYFVLHKALPNGNHVISIQCRYSGKSKDEVNVTSDVMQRVTRDLTDQSTREVASAVMKSIDEAVSKRLVQHKIIHRAETEEEVLFHRDNPFQARTGQVLEEVEAGNILVGKGTRRTFDSTHMVNPPKMQRPSKVAFKKTDLPEGFPENVGEGLTVIRLSKGFVHKATTLGVTAREIPCEYLVTNQTTGEDLLVARDGDKFRVVARRQMIAVDGKRVDRYENAISKKELAALESHKALHKKLTQNISYELYSESDKLNKILQNYILKNIPVDKFSDKEAEFIFPGSDLGEETMSLKIIFAADKSNEITLTGGFSEELAKRVAKITSLDVTTSEGYSLPTPREPEPTMVARKITRGVEGAGAYAASSDADGGRSDSKRGTDGRSGSSELLGTYAVLDLTTPALSTPIVSGSTMAARREAARVDDGSDSDDEELGGSGGSHYRRSYDLTGASESRQGRAYGAEPYGAEHAQRQRSGSRDSSRYDGGGSSAARRGARDMSGDEGLSGGGGPYVGYRGYDSAGASESRQGRADGAEHAQRQRSGSRDSDRYAGGGSSMAARRVARGMSDDEGFGSGGSHDRRSYGPAGASELRQGRASVSTRAVTNAELDKYIDDLVFGEMGSGGSGKDVDRLEQMGRGSDRVSSRDHGASSGRGDPAGSVAPKQRGGRGAKVGVSDAGRPGTVVTARVGSGVIESAGATGTLLSVLGLFR